MAGRGRLDRRAALGIMGKMAGVRALAQTSQIYVGKPPPGVITRVGGAVTFPVTSGLQVLYEPWREAAAPPDDQLVTDLSGNGFHGQLGSTSGADANDPTWVSDVGLRFDGVDDHVKATITGASGSVFTMSAVVLVNSSNKAIASAGTTNTDWQVFIQAPGDLYLRSVYPSGGDVIWTGYSAAHGGDFVHLVATGNGTAGNLYVNGALKKTGTTTVAFDQDPQLWIGDLGDTYPLNGDIAGFSLSNIAWTAAQVASVYNYIKSVYPTGVTGDMP